MSTKDFKQGMVAGAKPFGDKLDQLATVSEAGVADIKEGLDNVAGIVSTVLDDLSIQEKKKIYDLDEATDISLLEDDEKEFLVAVLMELANIVNNTSELQKKYLGSICNVTGISNPQTYADLSHIENIENTKTQKILLRHIMEFFFIGTGDYSFLDDYDDDVFSYFSVNKRGFNEIKSIIDRINTAMGVDGIANRYTFIAGYDELLAQEENYSESSSEETTEDFEEDIPAELEDICITNMLQIHQGETKVFKYKNIHFKSITNCAGTLEFDNCVIYYNEFGYSDEITFEENSSLIAKNCTFICNDLDENFFMTFSDKCNITIENCIFKDCSHFITTPSLISFNMNGCRLDNCARKFFFMDTWSAAKGGSCIVENTYIENNNTSSFNLDDKLSGNYYDAFLFKINTEKCIVRNITVKSEKGSQYFERYFELEKGELVNCTFENARSCVKSILIEGCLFKNCRNAVETIENYEFKANITSCVFANCTEAIQAEQDTIIAQCKFIECYNNIINTRNGGIEISFCEFINCKNTDKDKYQSTNLSDPIACIRFEHGKKRLTNIIKKCIFDGIDIDEGFLIKCCVWEDPKTIGVNVVECDFRNCSTKRTSGKIIKTMAHYYGLFETLKIVDVVRIENCRGLDKVKKQASKCSDTSKIALTAVNGNPVGSTMPKDLELAAAMLAGQLLTQQLNSSSKKNKEKAEKARKE